MPARRRLIWKLTPVLSTAIIVLTLAVAWYTGNSADRFVHEFTLDSLADTAHAVAGQSSTLIAEGKHDELQALCEDLYRQTGNRITIIAPDGTVVGESHADKANMDNHRNRPEIYTALDGKVGHAKRMSGTLDELVMYVAVPLVKDDQIIGVARVSIPDKAIHKAIGRIVRRVLLGGLLAAGLIGLILLWAYTRYINRPLESLRLGAKRFAEGQLDRTIRVADTEEIGSVAEALNSMGRQLNEKISTISNQAKEREAVLASMTEGVLAVDSEQQIISLNRAGAALLGVEAKDAPGKSLAEVVRNAELLRFISRVQSAEKPIEGELTLVRGRETRTVAASATTLRSGNQKRLGAVLVLNDITRLRELENVRQQFVANVSHELKTPITAIKAAVETVMSGDEEPDTPDDEHRNDDRRETDAASRRFLPIIARQADRLNAIIEDLLMLARLEQSTEQGPTPLEPMRLLPILRGAAETCQANADTRGMDLSITCEPELTAMVNDTLLGQAIVNLLDNAIKYAPAGKDVDLTAKPIDNHVVISVRDRGYGIEPEHLPRLFERFYRTDKARSREMGGTGLGLAIVKHVAQTHGGRVTVDSKPGEGSTFSIHLKSEHESTSRKHGANPEPTAHLRAS